MRNYTLSKFLLVPLLLCLSFLAHAEKQYSSVYIFGDSLSDTGNLASVLGAFPEPYFQNRLSNGPIAVDTLTAKLNDTAAPSLHLIGLNAGHNYSVAGATAAGSDSIDLDTQVMAFQANHSYIAPRDALYVIFIGGNDIRTALYASSADIAKTIINTASKKIINAINSLYQSGARSFLIINAPNIASIPETRINASLLSDATLLERAEYLSKHLNKKIHKSVENLEENKAVSIQEFNLFSLFNKVINNASKYGFTNTTDACFSSVTYTFHPDCNYGLNADKFVFFDEIHPTTRIHTMFGEAFYQEIID